MSRFTTFCTALIVLTLLASVTQGGPLILHDTVELSEARSHLAATATSTRALFAGGWTGSSSDRVDYYDIQTDTWSTGSLPSGIDQQQAAAIGDIAVFGGGSIGSGGRDFAFVFDDNTSQFDTDHLLVSRYDHTAAAVGNKILFAGGDDNGSSAPGGQSDVVDIYEVSSAAWTNSSLSVPRANLAAAATAEIAMFAGGNFADGGGGASDVVDIYHVDNGSWTTATLSQPRVRLAGVSNGEKVFFAGGWTTNFARSDVVDIYDADTGQWTVEHLSQPRAGLVAATAGDYVFFAGGSTDSEATKFDVVDVYDTVNDSWSVLHLSQPRDNLAAVSFGNTVMFAGGVTASGPTSRVDVFTVVPEPSSLVLLVTGALGLLACGWRRQRD